MAHLACYFNGPKHLIAILATIVGLCTSAFLIILIIFENYDHFFCTGLSHDFNFYLQILESKIGVIDWNHKVSDKQNGSNREAGRYDDCELAPRHGIAAVFVRDLSNEITAEPGFQNNNARSDWLDRGFSIILKILLSPVVLHVVINRPTKAWDSLYSIDHRFVKTGF